MLKHSISVILNLQRENKQGKYPLRIRVIVDRKAIFYPTGIVLTKEQWDPAKKEIVAHPHKVALNRTLRKKVSELEEKLIEADYKGEPLTKPKKKNADFVSFCEAKIEEQKRQDKPATTKHKNADLNILKMFKQSISFNSITTSFLHSFEDFCRQELNNINNTVWGHIKFVKGMLNEAAKEGVYDKKLIADYKAPKYVDPEREYLVLEEVDKIEAFRNETSIDKLRNVADWFLFSCYTGFRYEDVRTFSKEKIQQGKIILRTSKKGVDVTLAIHPRLQKVLDRMPKGVYSNQKANDFLKIIDAQTGINKELTFHQSRHSFAVIFLELGGSLEELQKLLGHSKISTTAIYGKITNKRLDMAMQNTWGKV